MIIGIINRKAIRRAVPVARRLLSNMTKPQGRCQHFSFLLRRNKILGCGWNRMDKTHRLAYAKGYTYGTIHSEFHLLNQFNFIIPRNCWLLNIRIGKDGTLRCAFPCDKCLNLLMTTGLNQFVCSTNYNSFSLYVLEELAHESETAGHYQRAFCMGNNIN